MHRKQHGAPDRLSVKRIVTDGSIMSALLGSIVMAIVYYNAEIMHDDYPPHIQEKALPMSDAAKKQRVLVTIPFIFPGIVLGMGMPTVAVYVLLAQLIGPAMKNAGSRQSSTCAARYAARLPMPACSRRAVSAAISSMYTVRLAMHEDRIAGAAGV